MPVRIRSMYLSSAFLLIIYTIEEDEEGFQVVKRYKVNWKMPAVVSKRGVLMSLFLKKILDTPNPR